MKLFILISIFFSLVAQAETAKITVDGMHCKDCEKMIQRQVCEDVTMKDDFESCTARVTDKKKQIGEVVVVAKKDRQLKIAEIQKNISATGIMYKVKKTETK